MEAYASITNSPLAFKSYHYFGKRGKTQSPLAFLHFTTFGSEEKNVLPPPFIKTEFLVYLISLILSVELNHEPELESQSRTSEQNSLVPRVSVLVAWRSLSV